MASAGRAMQQRRLASSARWAWIGLLSVHDPSRGATFPRQSCASSRQGRAKDAQDLRCLCSTRAKLVKHLQILLHLAHPSSPRKVTRSQGNAKRLCVVASALPGQHEGDWRAFRARLVALEKKGALTGEEAAPERPPPSEPAAPQPKRKHSPLPAPPSPAPAQHHYLPRPSINSSSSGNADASTPCTGNTFISGSQTSTDTTNSCGPQGTTAPRSHGRPPLFSSMGNINRGGSGSNNINSSSGLNHNPGHLPPPPPPRPRPAFPASSLGSTPVQSSMPPPPRGQHSTNGLGKSSGSGGSADCSIPGGGASVGSGPRYRKSASFSAASSSTASPLSHSNNGHHTCHSLGSSSSPGGVTVGVQQRGKAGSMSATVGGNSVPGTTPISAWAHTLVAPELGCLLIARSPAPQTSPSTAVAAGAGSKPLAGSSAGTSSSSGLHGQHLTSAALAAPTPASGHQHQQQQAASAEVSMGFFSRAVVLLTAHDPVKGSVGIVLNKPAPLVVGDLQVTAAVPGFETVFAEQPLLLGGPVHLDHVTLLHRYRGLHGSQCVAEGLYTGGLPDAVQLVQAGMALPSDFALALGMAGWAPKQLENEIAAGLWHVVAASPDLVLPPRGSALHMAQLAAQAQRRRCKEMIGALPCGSGTSSTTAPDSLEECITEDDGAVGGGADSAPAPCTSHSVTSAHSSVNSRSGSQPRHAGGSRPLPGAVAPPSKECSSSGGGGASAPTAAAHTSTDLSHLPPILAAAERAERAARAAARSLLCESSVRESHIPPLQPPPSLPQAPEAAHLNSACMWSRIRAAAQL